MLLRKSHTYFLNIPQLKKPAKFGYDDNGGFIINPFPELL